MPYLSGLYFITDKGIHLKKNNIDLSIDVIRAGVNWIQFRDKNNSRLQLYKTARILKTFTDANDVKLIINDHPDIALAIGAYGVHLGQDDLPLKEARRILGKKIIGISTHSIEEAIAAQDGGADYIGFGPIFHTKTKDALTPRGLESLKEIKKHINIPVVAIGGIAEETLTDVFDAGADAVAVASGITKQDDITKAAERYMKIIGDIRQRT